METVPPGPLCRRPVHLVVPVICSIRILLVARDYHTPDWMVPPLGGRSSLIESPRVLDCNLSCSSLRRDELDPIWLLLVVELLVYPGSVTSINGRIGCLSRPCSEDTGSGGTHTHL